MVLLIIFACLIGTTILIRLKSFLLLPHDKSLKNIPRFSFSYHLNLFGSFIRFLVSFKRFGAKRIAIIGPTSQPLYSSIVKGFSSKIKENSLSRVQIKTFNTDHTKAQISSYVDEIINSNFDLVLSLSPTATELIIHTFEQKKIKIPVVISGLMNSDKNDLYVEKQRKGFNLTGVFEGFRNYEQQVSLLLTLQPTLQNILVICNPSGNDSFVGKEFEMIKKVFQKKNIMVKGVFIDSPDQVIAQIAPELKNTDIIMVLRDDTVLSVLDSIIKKCEKHKKGLFVSDGNSVKKGASFGFGAIPSTSGEQEAFMAHQIINLGISAKKIPIIRSTSSEKIFINPKALKRHGVELSPDILMILKYVETHNQSTSN